VRLTARTAIGKIGDAVFAGREFSVRFVSLAVLFNLVIGLVPRPASK